MLVKIALIEWFDIKYDFFRQIVTMESIKMNEKIW